MRTVLLVLWRTVFFFMGCTKKEKQECGVMQISAAATTSDPCIAQGTVTVVLPQSGGMQYSLGNSGFQASPVFNNLFPGTYTITVKDGNDCSSSTDVTVLSVPSGPLFNEVKLLLGANCISCHGGPNPQAGLNWSRNCDIVNFWDRIKARAVDGNPTPMPQRGLLPLTERNKITNWINAGHRFTD